MKAARFSLPVALTANLTLLTLSACFHAPDIVLVDRATALEQQAAGSYRDLERELAHAGIAAKPAELTPEQLQALGMASGFSDDTTTTDPDRIDELLRRHCLGEARSGMLIETPDACEGAVDEALSAMLVARTNESRQQLWLWMHAQKPQLSFEKIKSVWTGTHQKGIVCGGWVEESEKHWDAKKC